MNKTDPTGIRFDSIKLGIIKNRLGIDTNQKLVNWLIDKYYLDSDPVIVAQSIEQCAQCAQPALQGIIFNPEQLTLIKSRQGFTDDQQVADWLLNKYYSKYNGIIATITKTPTDYIAEKRELYPDNTDGYNKLKAAVMADTNLSEKQKKMILTS